MGWGVRWQSDHSVFILWTFPNRICFCPHSRSFRKLKKIKINTKKSYYLYFFLKYCLHFLTLTKTWPKFHNSPYPEILPPLILMNEERDASVFFTPFCAETIALLFTDKHPTFDEHAIQLWCFLSICLYVSNSIGSFLCWLRLLGSQHSLKTLL